MFTNRVRRALLTGCALFVPTAALAQSGSPPSDSELVAPLVAATVGNKRVFTPADFARFAPRTAYDMLVQLPGFTLRTADQERGLGQASENVLVNGQRVANKSGGAIDELQKVGAADVERIEIVDAAGLGIAGLSGQVANVIVKAKRKASGQFDWHPDFRAHYSVPNFARGSISYSGTHGPIDYTFSAKDQGGRGAFGGPILLYDAQHRLIETRHETYHSESDLLTFQGKFGIDGPGSSVGNLTLAYTPYRNPAKIRDRRDRRDGDNRERATDVRLNGWYCDVSGDYAFALGPGRLKLIGLRHFDHEPVITSQVMRFDSGADPDGVRFRRNSHIGETVGRAEYHVKTGKNDLTFSLERAYNSLDQHGSLYQLASDGSFSEVSFPEGSGKVVETRYEGLATWSRAVSPKLDLQVAGGGEISTLDRVDGDLPPRKFFRPKGSVTVGWRPAPGWDASFKLRRRVGQISFYDFLAQPNLQQDRENSGNPDLVPPQSWEVEVEAGRELGRWGKTRLTLYGHRIDDIVDVIPVGTDGEGIGNLPRATRVGLHSVTTLLGDPIGWKGAKLDADITVERTRVRDPLTGAKRSISGNQDVGIDVNFRHDIPRSQIAYGAEASYSWFAKNYYISEVYRSWEGPVFFDLYVEHKNLLGMTARFTVANILDARHRRERVVYQGRRGRDPVDFFQHNDQLIGPIFVAQMKGRF